MTAALLILDYFRAGRVPYWCYLPFHSLHARRDGTRARLIRPRRRRRRRLRPPRPRRRRSLAVFARVPRRAPASASPPPRPARVPGRTPGSASPSRTVLAATASAPRRGANAAARGKSSVVPRARGGEDAASPAAAAKTPSSSSSASGTRVGVKSGSPGVLNPSPNDTSSASPRRSERRSSPARARARVFVRSERVAERRRAARREKIQTRAGSPLVGAERFRPGARERRGARPREPAAGEDAADVRRGGGRRRGGEVAVAVVLRVHERIVVVAQPRAGPRANARGDANAAGRCSRRRNRPSRSEEPENRRKIPRPRRASAPPKGPRRSPRPARTRRRSSRPARTPPPESESSASRARPSVARRRPPSGAWGARSTRSAPPSVASLSSPNRRPSLPTPRSSNQSMSGRCSGRANPPRATTPPTPRSPARVVLGFARAGWAVRGMRRGAPAANVVCSLALGGRPPSRRASHSRGSLGLGCFGRGRGGRAFSFSSANGFERSRRARRASRRRRWRRWCPASVCGRPRAARSAPPRARPARPRRRRPRTRGGGRVGRVSFAATRGARSARARGVRACARTPPSRTRCR